MSTSQSSVITLDFTRDVHAHELRPGDVFTVANAPSTPLTVILTTSITLSPELTVISLTLPGDVPVLHLPANTPVHAHRMVRTVTLACLLCRKDENIELNLPRDGEPLSVVCGRHLPDPEVKP
ncbi:hypothetical protein [Streptomyces sp. NPDC057909]|uniref:hypothetical protein n=1 Tax=Streptomyces sp. NPDC057909 TaxID=3346277 RepID=UPI0036EDB54F